jgi:hypothetical protein
MSKKVSPKKSATAGETKKKVVPIENTTQNGAEANKLVVEAEKELNKIKKDSGSKTETQLQSAFSKLS